MEMNDRVKTPLTAGKRHRHMHLVPPIAAAVILGFAVLVASVTLLLQGVLLRPGREVTPSALPALPSFGDGASVVPLLLGLVLLVLVGVFVLLLLLVICMCGCKSGGRGLPLPPLPDLKAVAAILRGVAAALRDGATKIDTANGIVNEARGKLTGFTDFKVSVPKFKSIGHIDVGFFRGEAWVPDGFEDKSIFDNATAEKLRTFANDVTGKTALDGASAMLNEKAGVLDEQATTLEGLS